MPDLAARLNHLRREIVEAFMADDIPRWAAAIAEAREILTRMGFARKKRCKGEGTWTDRTRGKPR